MKIFIVGLLFLSCMAHAGRIEDVRVLEVKFEKKSFKVKLQLKDAKPDAYFTVQIGMGDVEALDKIALILKKVKEKDAFKLTLSVPSFSPQSGSFYRSDYVTFLGSAEGESLLAD